MQDDEPLMVKCVHGERPGCVVCVHMTDAIDQIVGFVENSSDPNDLQAWCDQCEAFFLKEQKRTEDFDRFCDIRIVCDVCYAELRERHSASD